MGRGSSKVGSGGGAGGAKTAGAGGAQIKDIENVALKSILQDITMIIMTGRNYSYSRSQKDGKTIDKNTGIGDIFTHGTVSYQKTGADQWTQVGDPTNVFASDGMARILAGLTSLPGSWTYKKK